MATVCQGIVAAENGYAIGAANWYTCNVRKPIDCAVTDDLDEIYNDVADVSAHRLTREEVCLTLYF